MPATSGLTYEQLDAQKTALKNSGATESTSKALGKIVNAMKVLKPAGFSPKDVASAQLKLDSRTNPSPSAVDPSTGLPAGSLTPSGTGLGGGTGGTPAIDVNAIYQQALNDNNVAGLTKDLEAKKAAVLAANNNVNDNPFYSEAVRVGKLAKVNQSSQQDIANTEGQLTTAKADAQVKLNVATQQYNINEQQYKDNLDKLNLLISSGAIMNANGSDISQIAVATGLTTSMVKGIQAAAIKREIKPQVITNTDNSGKVTVSVIDANTGKTIAQNSLGTIGAAAKASGTKDNSGQSTKFDYTNGVKLMSQDISSVRGADGYISPQDYKNFASQWVAAGGNAKDFTNNFGIFVNPSHPKDYSFTFKNPTTGATVVVN